MNKENTNSGHGTGIKELLEEAFSNFTRASESLELYYRELQERIRYLTEELEKKNRALEDALNFLNAIIQSMEDAVLVIDPYEKIIMMNHSAENLFGVKADEFNGRYLSEIDFTIHHEGADAILTASGKKRTIMLSNSPVMSRSDGNNSYGELLGEVIVIKDITRLRELESQYERNQRLIAMGEMAARIVHELRNPLCSIELFATMLEREDLAERGKSLARGIATGIRSMNNILTNMLIFARPGRVNLRPVSSSGIIKEILSILEPLILSGNIKIRVSQDEYLVMADPELLKQALLNICINSIQAMPEGGLLTVELKEEGGYVCFSIKDTGCGIEPELRERIFDPFFTTKENGTGLGLAITAKIVQSHGGFIKVDSIPGKGTEFIVSIPSPDNRDTLKEVFSEQDMLEEQT
jgi:PAS domain S-box-containing protein